MFMARNPQPRAYLFVLQLEAAARDLGLWMFAKPVITTRAIFGDVLTYFGPTIEHFFVVRRKAPGLLNCFGQRAFWRGYRQRRWSIVYFVAHYATSASGTSFKTSSGDGSGISSEGSPCSTESRTPL